MRYDRSKSEATTGTLWEAQTKTAKKDYFTKNLSSPRFFEINTSNFQKMFLDIFKKFFRKKKYLKKNKQKKTVFFCLKKKKLNELMLYSQDFFDKTKN